MRMKSFGAFLGEKLVLLAMGSCIGLFLFERGRREFFTFGTEPHVLLHNIFSADKTTWATVSFDHFSKYKVEEFFENLTSLRRQVSASGATRIVATQAAHWKFSTVDTRSHLRDGVERL